MKRKLFVGNLSWEVDDQQLGEFFSQIGAVEEAVVIRDRFKGNRSKGFGFVTFQDADDAAKAIEELNGAVLDGREINVSEARDQEE